MATYCENFKVESAFFKDCASTSHAIVGNFTQAVEEQVCFVRGLETIELYSRGFTFIADYKMPNLKIKDLSKLTLNGHDVLVIHENVLKFIVIAFIDFEFRTLCLFNFEHMDELKPSGKKFPLNGMLRGFQDWGFVFISDDTLLCSVQTQANLPSQTKLSKNLSASSAAIEEDIADENYLYARMGNAFPGVISDFFKPLKVNQLKSHGIVSIKDIQLVKQDSITNTLLVLHQGDLDKLVGTKARHPVSRISILEVVKGKQQINLLLTIDNLSQFCKQIQPAFLNSDFCYVTTPFSIYLIRIEKNWVSEIQLSSVAKAIQDNFSKDANKQLLLVPSQTQRSVFDQCSLNMKLDGSRMASLPDNKLIVALQNGEFKVIQFKFDQANIDLAEVIITKVEHLERRQPSSIAVSENLIYMTSYFQDTCCFSLSQSQNTEQIFAGQELEKRQRLGSGTELTRVGRQSNLKYNMTLVDSLVCISPITDLVQMPSDGQSVFSHDFLLSSGSQTESYVTYASRQMPLNITNSGLQGLEVFRCRSNILVNQEDSTTKVFDLDLNPVQSGFDTTSGTEQTVQSLQLMKCGTKIFDGVKTIQLDRKVKHLCCLNEKYFGISNGKVCQVDGDRVIQTQIQASYISVFKNQLISTDGDRIQVFDSSNLENCHIQFDWCSRQPPYLRKWANDTRSITDPSYELLITDTTEVSTKILMACMVELKQVVCLICHRSDGRVLLYQQCSVDTYKLLTPHLLSTLSTETLKVVTMEDAAILFSDTMIPLLIAQRHGIVYCVQFSNEVYKSLVYINQLYFVAVSSQNEILNIKIPKTHDPNLHSVHFSDGYVMKRHVFEAKGIKQMTKFRPMGTLGEQEYLFIATFIVKPPQSTQSFEQGFVADTKAPDTIYTLLVYKCPKSAQEINLFQAEPIATEKFNDNQMITGLSEVTLQNQDSVFKTYMTVTSLTIDTTKRKDDERGFYSSSLRIYQIHQNKLKTCLVESYKRSVTVVSSFMGQLVCSKIWNTLPDLLLVFQSFNEQKSLFDVDKSFPIPDGSVKNLANCISFDQDFIFIGDTLTNIQILKKNNEQENKIDGVDQKKLHFKKYLSNNINANVVGCYSMSRYLNYDRTDLVRRMVDAEGTPLGQCKEMSETAKRMLCILGFSTDGYIRMYGVREEKTLQIVAQLNIQDKILATKPLFIFKNSKEELHERQIAVITQRSGVQIVTPCSEKTHRAWASIRNEMSDVLPFKGALTPTHSNFEPTTTEPEVSNFYQRLNDGAINLTQSLDQFHFLQQNIQQHLQQRAGLEDLNQLK